MRRILLLIPIAISAALAGSSVWWLQSVERALAGPCPWTTPDPPTFLSWTGDPQTTMTVSWSSPTRAAVPHVEYGLAGGNLGARAGAKAVDITIACREWRYYAVLTGLREGTGYAYRVAMDNATAGSVHPFRTAPAPGIPFTFLAVGDMGTSANASMTVATMAVQDYDFVIHAGDISYAGSNQTNWSRWFGLVEPLASEHPYMVVPGNHENGSALENGYYRDRFSLPAANPLDPDRQGMYYSFNYSSVHFVALKTDFPRRQDDTGEFHENLPTDPNWDPVQTAWLQRDLEAAAKDSVHPWIVVYFHFPPFTTASWTASFSTARQVWGELFDRYHVALVIGGHKHQYERTFPVPHDWVNGTALGWRNRTSFYDPRWPVYVVTGGGGEKLQPAGPPMPWSAKRNRTFEFLRVSVGGDRLNVAALYSSNGSAMDTFSLVRGNISAPASGASAATGGAPAEGAAAPGPGTPALDPVLPSVPEAAPAPRVRPPEGIYHKGFGMAVVDRG